MRISRNELFDFETRISRGTGYYGKGHIYGKDNIEGLYIPWTYEIISIEGAWYHCWISKNLTKEEQEKLKEQFLTKANLVGDVVKITWDYLPENEEEDYDPTPCCYQHSVGAIGTNEPCPEIADNE